MSWPSDAFSSRTRYMSATSAFCARLVLFVHIEVAIVPVDWRWCGPWVGLLAVDPPKWPAGPSRRRRHQAQGIRRGWSAHGSLRLRLRERRRPAAHQSADAANQEITAKFGSLARAKAYLKRGEGAHRPVASTKACSNPIDMRPRNPACPPAGRRLPVPGTIGCFRRKPLRPSRRCCAHRSWSRSTAS